jgi:predicted oxidoreductase
MAWNPLGNFYKDKDSQVIRLKNILAKLSAKYGLGADVLLIAWLLKHPAGILPVFGTTDLLRIKNLTKSLQVKLDLEDWFVIWTESMGKNVP